MDKKDVMELIDIARENLISTTGDSIEDDTKVSLAIGCLDGIKDKLSIPDWISVEENLPEYWEKVLVTDKEHPNHVWISHREDEKSPRKQDKNGFPLWKYSYPYYEVTHWSKIDKLEV